MLTAKEVREITNNAIDRTESIAKEILPNVMAELELAIVNEAKAGRVFLKVCIAPIVARLLKNIEGGKTCDPSLVANYILYDLQEGYQKLGFVAYAEYTPRTIEIQW